jgi:ABC-2 type transport system permease protein
MKFTNIKQAIFDAIEITVDEWRHVFKDSGVVLVFFAACIIYPVLYGFIYYNELYRNIPIAVVNHSPSNTSRTLLRKIDATPELKLTYKVNSMAEAKTLYDEDKVKGIVYIPNSFNSDIAAGKQTVIFGYCNMSGMMYYKGFYSGVQFACLDMNLQIKMKAPGISSLSTEQMKATTQPIIGVGHGLYNPTGGFPSFLMPAVLVLILQQTLVLGIGMLAGTAREENAEHHLIPSLKRYHRIQRVVWGKALAYLILYLFLGVYDLVFIPHIFKLPHLVSLWELLPFLLPYLLASIFFGMALSVFWWNREMPLLIFLCTSVPLLFISGFSWPTSHIHPFWQMVGMFFPSTFGIHGFLQLNSQGATLTQIGPKIVALWIQAGFYFVFTWFAYNWQIQKSLKINSNAAPRVRG